MPFHLHATVTPTISANSTYMHRCQRSGLASTAIHTFYSAVCKENSTQQTTFYVAGTDSNIYLRVSKN